ncbi:hypothetical protein AVEN_58197-1 [Araneus ventricosus]|uniref:Sushi domain-containing protein n=1 Tax=Araneus ventricosus TaxID=182803 RepID=A0A4Y2RKN6_ARAVE|nr:hypothetical protein AVEN_58197-1 [Araneus ventricosus]
MLVKYSPGFQAPSVLRLAGWVLLIPQFFCATTTCPPPDFPDRGGYEPVKAEYEVGQTVAYHCYGGLPVFDENHIWIQGLQPVTCQSNGKWSGGTIFCEVPIKLKNPITSSKALESAVLDDNSDTCSPTGNDTEEFLRFTLDHEAVVFSTMVCWGEGNVLSSAKDYVVQVDFASGLYWVQLHDHVTLSRSYHMNAHPFN